MKGNKLYQITSKNYEVFSHTIQGDKIFTLPADNIPMLRWPDGHWCFLANLYMLELYQLGRSRKNNGGTLLTYTANISPLIRYCYNNRIDLIDLTDSRFTFFIKTLLGERRSRDPDVRVRDANSVIAIGHNCIDFLKCVGKFYNDDNFIGEKGRIVIQKREMIVRYGRSKKRSLVKTYWHHRSFPTPDAKKKRLPINTDNVRKLREAILPASNSIYVRKRRYTMLTLLEITGARRFEVAKLRVESVRNAARMAEPALELATCKRPGGKEENRVIPITRTDLNILLEFIDKNRQLIIKRTCGVAEDDGFVLVNERTGKGLSPNTVTQEISLLRKQAGITSKACPHMFRHRYITKIFVAMIEQHEYENVDNFRRALLEQETMKQKIMEWTGHKNIGSLEIYIHLAFEEAAHYKKTCNVVSATRVIDSLRTSFQQIKAELKAGIATSTEAILQIEKYIDAATHDFERLTHAPTA